MYEKAEFLFPFLDLKNEMTNSLLEIEECVEQV